MRVWLGPLGLAGIFPDAQAVGLVPAIVARVGGVLR